MSGVADKLEALNVLKIQLAENLRLQGVETSDAEGLATLVPKVLDIICGDPLKEGCRGRTTQLTPRYGYYGAGEAATFDGAVAIDALSRMDYAVVTISGEGVDTLQVSAQGWEQTEEDGSIFLTCELDERTTRFRLQEKLEEIRITSSASALVDISVFCVGKDSGEAYQIGDSLQGKFADTVWEVVSLTIHTWQDTEGLTWRDMETIPKPTA